MKSLPKNLNLFSFSFPITAIVSILHRVTGIILLLAVPFLIWVLDISLTPSGFSWLQALISEGWARFFVWAALSALTYHWVAGIRHILMDFSIGISLTGGKLGARLVFVISFLIILLLGVYLW